MSSEINTLVGFDLGHGDTSLSAINLKSNDPRPYLLEIRNNRVQPTAIAYDARRGVLLGRVALVNSVQASEFHISFKKKPDSDPRYQKLIKDYVRACLDQAEPKILLEETLCYVGCPSGWDDKAVRNYKEIISSAGIPNLEVIRESRAALLQANEERLLDQAQVKGTIFLIDVGSSTTDCTLLFPDERTHPFDFGNNLGASLIDKAILAYSLSVADEREKIETAFAQDPKHHDRCEYKCRTVKEEYFDNLIDGVTDWNTNDSGHISIQDLMFIPVLDYEIMKSLLQQPMAEIAGKRYSWPDAFRLTLEMAKKFIEDSKTMPSVILLTGGHPK